LDSWEYFSRKRRTTELSGTALTVSA